MPPDLLREVGGATSSAHLVEELRMAVGFQRVVLPKPPTVDFLRMDVSYRRCDGVSGDVYDFVLSRESEVGVFVGDATGHGVVAAFMTMMVHLALDGLCPDLATDEVLRRLNTLLDWGQIRLEDALAGEIAAEAIASVGVGARWHWKTSLSVSADLGLAVDGAQDTQAGDVKIHFNAFFRY